jgi:hypothetical protein
MRRLIVLAAVVLAAAGMVAPVAPSAGAAAAPCAVTWGSLPKTSAPMTSAAITNIRGGRHNCYDRLVFDLGAPQVAFPGQAAGYDVRYVRAVTLDGSGQAIRLAGGAFLQVNVHANAYNVGTGVPTYRPANRARAVNVTGFRTFRQVYFGGTFEGITTVGLGVRARLPFRVFVLAGPGRGSRLVIDVAHTW